MFHDSRTQSRHSNGDAATKLDVELGTALPPHLPPRLGAALDQLARAQWYAASAGLDPWQFAVEMSVLVDMGLTPSDLRWLVTGGYAQHAYEITDSAQSARTFSLGQNLMFNHKTCFTISPAGMALVVAWRGKDFRSGKEVVQRVDFGHSNGHGVPHWNVALRTLFLDGQEVKRFRVPALNQEKILAAFEEEGWPEFIDDPLPPTDEICPKRRLRDTIKCLNAHQAMRMLQFHGDGTGERVRWERLRKASAHE
jgi:hypothetical protein